MAPPVSASSSTLLPGPLSPAWWQLVRFAGDALGLLDECHRRYSDTFTLRFAGNGRFVMLSDPKVVRKVFQADPDVLHSGEANSLFVATVGRHSVLVLDGDPHVRQPPVLVPPLKGDRIRPFFDAMRLETLDAVRAWPVENPCPTLPSMRKVTLRIIHRAGLGVATVPELDRLAQKIEQFLSNRRQPYALVLIAMLPIERLAASRWVPLFRQ